MTTMQPLPQRPSVVRYLVLLVGVILLIWLTVISVLNTRKRKAAEEQVREGLVREQNLGSHITELGKGLAACHEQAPQTTDMLREPPRREFACRVICSPVGGKR